MNINISTRNSLFTPEQVAEILQIHILTVYSYIRQGKLNAVRLGRSYRVTPEDLDRLIESNRVKIKSLKKMGEGE
ncbi:MAG TPA: helix-turn-helix domain-containing protein [Dehalococcoidales bacterium]|nr:helix-turn-helix domain-containing protein [Dehalococcoidales bacterium]